MSIKVITAVLDLPPAVVSVSERMVLIALGWHADQHGRNAWPAVSTICQKTSLSRSRVQYLLPKLTQKGLVYVESKEPGRTVVYGLDLDVLDRATRAQSEPDTCPATGQGGVLPQDRVDATDAQAEGPATGQGCPATGQGCPATGQGCPATGPDPSLTVLDPSLKKNAGAARRDVGVDNHNDEKNGGEAASDVQSRLNAQERFEALAHAAFDALGNDAPFDALSADVRRRAEGLELVTPFLQDLGHLLYTIQQQRTAHHRSPVRRPR